MQKRGKIGVRMKKLTKAMKMAVGTWNELKILRPAEYYSARKKNCHLEFGKWMLLKLNGILEKDYAVPKLHQVKNV